jgi:hypothetical protein
VVGSDDGRHLKPHDGWKSPAALNSDLDRYVAQIQTFEGLLDVWNATHDNRCLGYCLFTSGIGVGWDTFQIREAEMKALA